ncbi:MAG: hypothetical protein QOJ42_2652 [Acidobacteriaceae bacterium]|nr:hypothetical protein [Acidobacteriaceae bacterium]
MKGFFLKTQRPEVLQNRSYPGKRTHFSKGLMTGSQPMSHAGNGLAEKGKRELRAVQAARPAPHCRRVGQAVRILEVRQCLFPRAVLHKAPPQRLAARHQTVMRVRKREQRKESEGLPAAATAAATDPYPIVVFVVCLLAAMSMTDDRIAFTNRTSA